jgi:hypothetical protein
MEIKPNLRRYLEHMPEGDDVTLIVLKGHLLVEELLDRTICTVVAHGDLLDEARLSFVQKTLLARAMCWTKRDSDMWDLVTSLNTLRNDLVHQLDSTKFEDRLRRVLQAHLSSIEDSEDRDQMQAETVPNQLRFAIVYMMGFLGSYEDDAKGYRSLVDRLLTALRSAGA